MKSVDLAIVGGGAAGMFAATVAAELGLGRVLFERRARIGTKVLMTANGRCNFTKDLSAEDFLADLAVGGVNAAAAKFVSAAIRQCPPRAIVKGFRSLDVPLRRMADGRMFPADGKAATIVHAFGDLLRDDETPILTNCAVTGVEPGFVVHTANFDLAAKNVLLATGGVSYPKTGSVGDGQNFARTLGHKLVPYRPGLIGMETDDPQVTRLAGRRFEDGRAKVLDDAGNTLFDYCGEVDCERFGLSGAAVYNCQRWIEHAVRERRGLDPAALTLEVWFDRRRLRYRGLKPRPVKEAIVTIGGVATDEIDAATMESKLVPGLYFAGEIMDIDGPTGGYNLTMAFATARLAVNSIWKKLHSR